METGQRQWLLNKSTKISDPVFWAATAKDQRLGSLSTMEVCFRQSLRLGVWDQGASMAVLW